MARKKLFLLDYPEEITAVLNSNDIEEIRSMLAYFMIHTNDRIEYLLNNACHNMKITQEQLRAKDYTVPDAYTQELLNESYTLLNIMEKAIKSLERERGIANTTNIENVINQKNKDNSKN